MMSTFTKCPWPCLHLRGCIGKKSISLILMKYLLLYQWPLRQSFKSKYDACKKSTVEQLNVCINKFKSFKLLFLWYWDYFNRRQNQTHVMSTSITVEWWIYNGINARTFHSNCDVQILAQKGHTCIYMYWTCQPVCQSLARPNVVLLSIKSWKPFAW